MEKSPGTEPSRDDGYLGYALSRAAHVWRAMLAKELAVVGTTPPQFFVLAALYYMTSRKGKRPTQKQLAARVAMDANTASQVIRGLEQRGLIIRSPHDEDKRAMALSLSPTGEDVARKSAGIARQLNERFFSGSNQEYLYRELDQLITNHASEAE